MNDWIEFLTFSAVAASRNLQNIITNMPERAEPEVGTCLVCLVGLLADTKKTNRS